MCSVIVVLSIKILHGALMCIIQEKTVLNNLMCFIKIISAKS